MATVKVNKDFSKLVDSDSESDDEDNTNLNNVSPLIKSQNNLDSNPAKKKKNLTVNALESTNNVLNPLTNILFFVKKKTREEDEPEIIYMCESTSKENLLLYLNYNKNKYFKIRLMNSFLYALTRLSYIPVLLSLIEKPNIISLILMGLTFAFSLKIKRVFTDDLKMWSYTISIILIIHCVHRYLQTVFIDIYEIEKNYYNGGNFWARFMALFLDGGNSSTTPNKPVEPKKTLRMLISAIYSSLFEAGRVL